MKNVRWPLFFLALVILLAPTHPASGQLDDEAHIAASRGIPRDDLALSAALRGTGPLPRVARTKPLDVAVGDIEEFWVDDPAMKQNRKIRAELRYSGPHVLMYVDTKHPVDQKLVEDSAKTFEQIYSRDRTLFGNEPSPGIDGDVRLTVINTSIRGAGGYFSATDGLVRGANRFSNERDMFVIDINAFPLGTDGYAATLAHEFQHMIHSRMVGSPSWFDEGLSSLAEDLNGFGDDLSPLSYLSSPDLSLLDWKGSGRNYGMAQLFMRYIYDQYAAHPADLIDADAGNDLDAFARLAARKRPDVRSFSQLFADWAVATLLNDPKVGDGRFAYDLRPAGPETIKAVSESGRGTVFQYGVDYLELPKGPTTLRFDGAETVSLTGAAPAEGRSMWWSNRSDQHVSTLTRALDLRAIKQGGKATLRFRAWYEIERSYDYAFVTISSDGGKTWKALATTNTTTDDPHGNNAGNGLTGVSGQPNGDIDGQRGTWVQEQADLSAYAGKQVQLRFWMVTDPAINGRGLLIDDLRVPEISLRDGFEAGEAGWTAQGFVRVGGTLPQRWVLRLVRIGRTTTVEPVPVDAQGRATVSLKAGEQGVLVVIGATRFTSEPAEYSYTLR